MSAWSAAIVLLHLMMPGEVFGQGDRSRIPERRLRTYLEALQSRDQQRVIDWARGNLLAGESDADAAGFAERALRLYVDWGGFELASITPVRQEGELVAVHALGRAPRPDAWYELQFAVGPAPEYRLGRLFLALSSPPVELPAGILADQDISTWLHDYVEKLGDTAGFSGGVLVARDDSTLVEAYAGWTNRDAGVRNSPAARFNVGSVGKLFTAVAALRLAEKGILDLDAPLARYLPDYPDRSFAALATVRHLLTHRSGLGDYWDDTYEAAWDTITTHQQLLPHIVRQEREFEPGERFAYSNSGYALAGLVLEAVTGRSFYDVVREEVFEPAGMRDAGYPIRQEAGPQVAVPYARDGRHRERQGARGSAAGGAYVTLPDMLAFARALWTGRLVGRSSLALMRDPAWATARGDRYGLGLFITENACGMTEEGHGGLAPGAFFTLSYFPQLHLTLVAAANRVAGGMESIHDLVRVLAARETGSLRDLKGQSCGE